MAQKYRYSRRNIPEQSTDVEEYLQIAPKGRSRPKKEKQNIERKVGEKYCDSNVSKYYTPPGDTRVNSHTLAYKKKAEIRLRSCSRGSNNKETSFSDSECRTERKITIYKPVKRSNSKESGDNYAAHFKDRLEEDRKCGAEKDDCSLSKSKKKCLIHQKKVYRPMPMKDECFQTENHDRQHANKECQASQELESHPSTFCKGEQCELLKTKTSNDIGMIGHSFPFIGRSPSGNLKVAPEMVSFENKSISVLVADPCRTKLTHKEWNDKEEHVILEGNHNKNYPPQSSLYKEKDRYTFTARSRDRQLNEPQKLIKTQHEIDNNLPSRPPKVPNYKPGCTLKKDHKRDGGNKLPQDKSPCFKRHHQRNYVQEMTAWDSPLPLFQPNDYEQENESKLKKVDFNTPDGQTCKDRDRYQGSVEFDHIVNYHVLNQSYNGKNYFDACNKSTQSFNPPKVPPFPRDTSPQSTIGGSKLVRETDGESSYQSSNAITLREKGSRGTPDFMENLHYRVKRAIHPDTKVLIGDKEFPIHSVALQIHSKYFDTLKRPQETVHKIELPESIVSPEDFQSLMDWILSDEEDKRSVFTRENVVGLYSTAQYLGIQELKVHCLKFIQEKVDSEDPKLIKLWEAAHEKPKTKELIALLSQKLTKLFPKLYKTRQFLKLDVNELVTLLDSDAVVIDSEMDIFDAAVRWLIFDWCNRKRYTVKTMSTIRFGLLSPLQLTQMRYLAEDKDAPDFKRIFSFDCVKKMLEDGLTFAILNQSYGERSGELEKWIIKTRACPPKSRLYLDTDNQNKQRMPEREYNQESKEPDKEDLKVHVNQGADEEMKALGDIVNKLKGHLPISNPLNKELINKYYPDPNADVNVTAIVNEQIRKDFQVNNDSSLILPNMPYTDDPSVYSLNNEFSGQYEIVEQKKAQIEAAVTIQRYIRGYLARKQLKKRKTAAIFIQRSLRSYWAKNQYRPVKEEPTNLKTESQPFVKLPYLMKNLDNFKGRVLVFGGTDFKAELGNGNSGQEIYMFTVDINLWMKVGKMPEPRTHFGIAQMNKEVYIVGGIDPRNTSIEGDMVVKSMWKVNLKSGEWNRDSGFPMDLPHPRSHFGCVSKDGILYAIGGKDEDSNPLSTCLKYDTLYNKWFPIASLVDGPRLSMGIVVYQGNIWVAGGISKIDNFPIYKSVLCYDIVSNRWTVVRDLPSPRAFCSLVVARGRLVLVGGAGRRSQKSEETKSLPDLLKFDSGAQKWKEVGLLRLARHGHASVTIGEKIIVLGGMTSTFKLAIKSVEIFDFYHSHSVKAKSLYQKLSGMGAIALT